MPKIFNSYIEPKEYQALQLKALLDEAFREGTFVLYLMLIIGLAILVLKVMIALQRQPCPHCNVRGRHIVDGHVVNCPQCRDTEEDEVYGITVDEIIELTEDDEDA